MNRTDRLLAILLELQAKGWQRAEDLAATFEVSKRTIYRDMLALAESNVPVVSSPGQGYSLIEGYFLPPLSFTTDEAIVLLLGTDYMEQSFDAQYQAAARSATSKIQTVLSQRLRDELRDLQRSMRFIALNPIENPTRPEIIQQLRRAILQRRTIRMTYHTRQGDDVAGRKNTREADPYALVHLDKAWYVSAFDHLRKDMRHFRLDRIDQLTVLNVTFTRPSGYVPLASPDTDRTISVRALFHPSIARWVREDPSFYAVALEDSPDGLVVTFRVRQEGDLLQYLLGWGARVRVLEPASVRSKLIEEMQAALGGYTTVAEPSS